VRRPDRFSSRVEPLKDNATATVDVFWLAHVILAVALSPCGRLKSPHVHRDTVANVPFNDPRPPVPRSGAHAAT
jgi:hypothetical protein